MLRLRPIQQAAGISPCFMAWVNLDGFTYMNGYAVNLIRIIPGDTPKKNQLEIPAMKMTLNRV